MFAYAKILSIAAIAALLAIPALPARAMSVQDYEALSPDARSEYVVRFLEKMTYDIGQQNPALAARIKDYYVRTPVGQPFSPGIADLGAELLVLDRLAKEGKVDLAKIQIEGVVVTITKREFPPSNSGSLSGKL